MSTITGLADELLRKIKEGQIKKTKPDASVAFKLAEMPVFWNWELVYTCNYRCSYCSYTTLGWESHYHMNAYPGLKRLTEIWTRLYKLYGSCHIEMSGGECSSYPRFYELLKMLTSMHTITMDTNLSFDVQRFAGLADVTKIRLATSFHPQFVDFKTFFDKCRYLQEKGISQIFVNYVAYPDQLKEMAECKRQFKEAGIFCFIQPFQGVYKKQTVYPDNYTKEEQLLIDAAMADNGADTQISKIRFAWQGSTMRSGTENQLRKIEDERAAQGVAPLLEKKPGKWSPFPWADLSPSETEQPKREPVLCRMGQKYAKTYANGDTFRCCAQLKDDMPWDLFREKVYLGNLFFDDDLRLLEEPALCDYAPCPCDRCMVVGQEARWVQRWNAPKN